MLIGGFLLIAFLGEVIPALNAQSDTAALSGTVTDETGAVIPNVQMTATNVGTGLIRRASTDERGSFLLLLLPPGTYAIRAERQRFAVSEVNNVILQVGDQRSASSPRLRRV
jgi:hypothetical protein